MVRLSAVIVSPTSRSSVFDPRTDRIGCAHYHLRPNTPKRVVLRVPGHLFPLQRRITVSLQKSAVDISCVPDDPENPNAWTWHSSLVSNALLPHKTATRLYPTSRQRCRHFRRRPSLRRQERLRMSPTRKLCIQGRSLVSTAGKGSHAPLFREYESKVNPGDTAPQTKNTSGLSSPTFSCVCVHTYAA